MNKDTQLIYEAYLKESKWGDRLKTGLAAGAIAGLGGGEIGRQIGKEQGKEQGYEKGYGSALEAEDRDRNVEAERLHKHNIKEANKWFNEWYGPENKDFKKNWAMAQSGKVPTKTLIYVLREQGYITETMVQEAYHKLRNRSFFQNTQTQTSEGDVLAAGSYSPFPNIVLTDPKIPIPVFKKDEITKMWTDFTTDNLSSSPRPDYVTKQPHPLFKQTTNIARARAGGEDREGPPIHPSMYDKKSYPTYGDEDAPEGLDCDNYAECFKQFVSKRLNHTNGVGVIAGLLPKSGAHAMNLVLVSDEHGLSFPDPNHPDPGFTIMQFEPQGGEDKQFKERIATYGSAGQSPTIYW